MNIHENARLTPRCYRRGWRSGGRRRPRPRALPSPVCLRPSPPHARTKIELWKCQLIRVDVRSVALGRATRLRASYVQGSRGVATPASDPGDELACSAVQTENGCCQPR